MKTLKDIDWHNDYGEGYEITAEKAKKEALKDGTYPTIDITELREEAIKHVLRLQELVDKDCIEDESIGGICYPEDRCSNCIEAEEADNQIWWIKKFFNITKEEVLGHSPKKDE